MTSSFARAPSEVSWLVVVARRHIGGSCIFEYLHLTLSASIFSCLRLLHYVFDGVSGCGFLGRVASATTTCVVVESDERWRASLAAVANEWLVSFAAD